MQRYYHQLLVNMMKIICVPFMLAPSSANMWLVPLVFSAFSLLLLAVLCMIITRANAIIIRGSTQYDNMWMWAWDEKEFAVKMDQSTKPFKMDPAKYSNKLMDFSPPPHHFGSYNVCMLVKKRHLMPQKYFIIKPNTWFFVVVVDVEWNPSGSLFFFLLYWSFILWLWVIFDSIPLFCDVAYYEICVRFLVLALCSLREISKMCDCIWSHVDSLEAKQTFSQNILGSYCCTDGLRIHKNV